MVTGEQLARAAQLIRDGELVAFPTETVYGLGANALDAGAVRRIFEMKGRPPTVPLIVHVDSIEMAQTLVEKWTEVAAELAARYWPGPLTMVLPKRPVVPDAVTAGLDTVGIRMPAHPVALALIRAARLPIAAPSANRFTQLSPTTAEHVREAFGNGLLVLDDGPTRVGIESTVISLAGPEPVLLRPGMIPFEGIRQIGVPGAGAHPSPGMNLRHYSPRTRLIIVDGESLPGGRVAYVWWSRRRPAAKCVQLPPDAGGFAAALYATLHDLDRESFDVIAVERPPEGAEWEGIADRLRRAAR